MGTQVRCHATPSTDSELGWFSYVLCVMYEGSGFLPHQFHLVRSVGSFFFLPFGIGM